MQNTYTQQNMMITLNCRCKAKIGIFPEEKVAPQTVEITLAIACNFSSAAITDHFEETIDYDVLKKTVEQICMEKHYNLCEHLGYEIASKLLSQFEAISSIQTDICKPDIYPYAKVSISQQLSR